MNGDDCSTAIIPDTHGHMPPSVRVGVAVMVAFSAPDIERVLWKVREKVHDFSSGDTGQCTGGVDRCSGNAAAGKGTRHGIDVSFG